MKDELSFVTGNMLESQLFERQKDDILHCLKYLYQDITDLKRFYIKLGFHLAEFERYGYYRAMGFETLNEFAEANLHMDKSSVSRCIAVWKKFGSVSPGSQVRTMFLDEKYEDYSYSQLCEMVSIKYNDVLAKVKPDMSVRQIRELKKNAAFDPFTALDNLLKKPSVATSQQEKKPLEIQTEIEPEIEPEKEKKPFELSKYSVLHGSALETYVKSRDALEFRFLYIFDKDGKMMFPELFGAVLDLMYDDGRACYFRLHDSKEKIDRIWNRGKRNE